MEILKIFKRRPGRMLAVRDVFLVRQTRTRSGESRKAPRRSQRRKGRKEEYAKMNERRIHRNRFAVAQNCANATDRLGVARFRATQMRGWRSGGPRGEGGG